ncbi:Oidioi.mRNA.OKI2018_I69.XSR.g16402.t1.cds [Oikopleura dioica]|uniref:Oidioi.mRNA.OKI2018_I69.XSR.g16402.t1.cds n=1 Tax=Oikopleura dioica TaxID=34765 RepID=A0ABN7SFZ5_OIKDI|nr:Oidioi.mRNA.OKI2018_I69.XSR.g16402.t1.cds [Oikopleura dioica]
MGSQPEMTKATEEEIPKEDQFKQPSQPADSSSQTEPLAEVKQLSQKMEELSSQEKPQEDEIISGDKSFFNEQFKTADRVEVMFENGDASPEERAEKKATKKRPLEDDEETSPTKKAHQMTASFLADHDEVTGDPAACSTQEPPKDKEQNSQGARSEVGPSQEIPYQIPGFIDAAEEEMKSVDSAEIVQHILGDIKEEDANGAAEKDDEAAQGEAAKDDAQN